MIPAYDAIAAFSARAGSFELAVWSDGKHRWTWTAYDSGHKLWAWDANVAWTNEDGGRAAALEAGLAWMRDRAAKMGRELQLLEAEPGKVVRLDRGPEIDPNLERLQRQAIALIAKSPKRANPGAAPAPQADAGHLPLFIAANEPRLI